MKTHRHWGFGAAVATATVTVLGCVALAAASVSRPDSRTTATPFNTLAILPISGPLAAIGEEQVAGLKAAVVVINKSGGILGHKVVLTVADDAGDGTKAVSALQQALAGGTKFNFIIPGAFGAEAIPLAAALAKNPVLQISPGSEQVLTNIKKFPYHFTTTTGFDPGTRAIAEKLKALGITRIAIIVGDDPSGTDGASSMARSAAAAGITVTTSARVPDNSVDATPQMQSVQASNPQALTMHGFTPANPAIIKARTKLGMTNLPFYLDDGAGAVNFGQFSTPADWVGIKVEGFPFQVKGTPTTETSVYRNFLKQFNKFDPKPVATIYAPLTTWEALMLARAAAIKAKSVDGALMAKAMPHVTNASMVPDWIGPKLIYSPTSHVPRVSSSDFIFTAPGPQVNGLLVPQG